jgi:pimeloyl-ACP methyl ester carboxylesterase
VEHAGTVLLIPGGLWEDTGADWFWRRTGVVEGLERRGFTVLAPDRIGRAANWAVEAALLAEAVAEAVADTGADTGAALTMLGGSFGCAAAVRLALDHPGLAGRLVLAWPASLSDKFTATRVRANLIRLGARRSVLDALLGGQTLPSATDAELRTLAIPVAVVPSSPPNALHPRSAADALLRLLPSAVELPGTPEAPRPEFAPHLESFLDAVTSFIQNGRGGR